MEPLRILLQFQQYKRTRKLSRISDLLPLQCISNFLLPVNCLNWNDVQMKVGLVGMPLYFPSSRDGMTMKMEIIHDSRNKFRGVKLVG